MWLAFRNHSTLLLEWQMHHMWTPMPPPLLLLPAHLPPQPFTPPIISFFFSPRAFIQPFFSSRHLQNSWKTSRPILVSCSFKRTGLNCHQWLFSLGFGTPQGPFVARGDLAKTGPGWNLAGPDPPQETAPPQRPRLCHPITDSPGFRPDTMSWPQAWNPLHLHYPSLLQTVTIIIWYKFGLDYISKRSKVRMQCFNCQAVVW